MYTADYWINHLRLLPHPEGGFYREEYRSKTEVATHSLPVGFKGPRSLCTSIHYLLRSGEYSRFHRLKSDEMWYFHAGHSLKVIVIDQVGQKHSYNLGTNAEKAERLSLLIPAGSIFCAYVESDDTYALLSCVVTPGFDFDDFEMFEKEDLIQAYPKHTHLFEMFG